MATQAYWEWLERGRPFRLATPISELKARGRAAGISWLGDLGNEAHLQANTPEDHTPFSVTAWPVALPGYVVTAIDWADGPHSDRLLAGAKSGQYPWIKYLNFRGKNYSVRRNWEPRSSSDDHLHISIRSDWHSQSIGSANPFTATPAVDPPGGFKPMFMMRITDQPTVYVGDGFQFRGINWDTFVIYRDTLKLPYILVPNGAAIEALSGEEWEADDAEDLQLTEAQMEVLREAARQGALEGAGTAVTGPTISEIEAAVDRQLDQQSHAGADAD
jgi:hypothetical protein